MSTILKRTIFVEKKKGGVHRFHDWTRVLTSLGMMYEPGYCTIGDQRGQKGYQALDWTDEMRRIDEIEFIDMDREKIFLSNDQGTNLHGGYCVPRVGR